MNLQIEATPIGYFVYWQTNNFGQIIQDPHLPRKNGLWQNPFKTRKEAEEYIKTRK